MRLSRPRCGGYDLLPMTGRDVPDKSASEHDGDRPRGWNSSDCANGRASQNGSATVFVLAPEQPQKRKATASRVRPFPFCCPCPNDFSRSFYRRADGPYIHYRRNEKGPSSTAVFFLSWDRAVRIECRSCSERRAHPWTDCFPSENFGHRSLAELTWPVVSQ
jgi:hypothetical protein